MSIDITELLKFKQEINEHINEYLDILQTNISIPENNNTVQKIMNLVISYYDRIKSIYENHQSDDDENTISDDDNIISDDDNDDYSNIMRNRVFINPNGITKKREDLDHEEYLKKKYFGCSVGFDKEFSNLDNMGEIYDDNSTDPTVYDDIYGEPKNKILNNNDDESVYNDDDDDEPGDCVANNIKKTIINYIPDSDIIIIEKDISSDDYNELSIE